MKMNFSHGVRELGIVVLGITLVNALIFVYSEAGFELAVIFGIICIILSILPVAFLVNYIASHISKWEPMCDDDDDDDPEKEDVPETETKSNDSNLTPLARWKKAN